MNTKRRYTSEELKEFDELIVQKIEKAEKELQGLKQVLKTTQEGMSTTSIKMPEDSALVEERERLNTLAARQHTLIQKLHDARTRIRKGTYGICAKTGVLIAKERLRAVPVTTESLAAKQRK